MFSKSKAFFSSLGVLIVLVSAFFWLAVTLGFASLENFIFEITNSKLFGYYIPEIIGFSYSDSETSKMMGIKLAFTAAALTTACMFIYLSFLDQFKKQTQVFFQYIQWFVLLVALFVLSRVVYDDNPMTGSDKLEFFVFISFCILILLSLWAFKNGGKTHKIKDSTVFTEDVSKKVLEGDKELNTSQIEDSKEVSSANDLSETIDNNQSIEDLDLEKKDDNTDTDENSIVQEDESDLLNDIDFNEKDTNDELADIGPSTKVLPPPSEELPPELMKLRGATDDSEDENISDEDEKEKV